MAHSVAVPVEDAEKFLRDEAHAAPVDAHEERRPKHQAEHDAAAPAAVAARAQTLEERVLVLETTHATSAELGRVKSELIKWVLFAATGVLVGVLSLVFALHGSTGARIDHVNTRIDEVNARIDQVNVRIDQMQSEMNSRFDQVNSRIDQLNQRLDAKFDAIMAELRDQRRERERNR